MLTYPQAVKELYFSLFGSASNSFHAELYCLIGKADMFDKERLRGAYPIEVQVWEDWQSSRGSTEFFSRFGLEVTL